MTSSFHSQTHTLQTLCPKAQPKHDLFTQVCVGAWRGQRIISTLFTEAQCRRAVSLPDVWPLWKHTDRLRVVRLFLQGSGSPETTKTQRPELRSFALHSLNSCTLSTVKNSSDKAYSQQLQNVL